MGHHDIQTTINEYGKVFNFYQRKEKEKYILLNRYIVGKTQMELSTELGISQAQISRLEKNGIESIKKLIL